MLATFPLTLALLLNGALAVAFAAYAWPRKGTPGARPFSVMNVLAAIAAWAYAGHIQSANASWDIWTQVRFTAQARPAARDPGALPRARRAAVLVFRAAPCGPRADSRLVLSSWQRRTSRTISSSEELRSRRAVRVLSLTGEPGPILWLFLIYAAVVDLLGRAAAAGTGVAPWRRRAASGLAAPVRLGLSGGGDHAVACATSSSAVFSSAPFPTD